MGVTVEQCTELLALTLESMPKMDILKDMRAKQMATFKGVHFPITCLGRLIMQGEEKPPQKVYWSNTEFMTDWDPAAQKRPIQQLREKIDQWLDDVHLSFDREDTSAWRQSQKHSRWV